MIKDLFKDFPVPLQRSLEKQLLDAIREADSIHMGPVPMHDIEAMKICAKLHAVMSMIRKFRDELERDPGEE